jgi:lysophospholipase L1-like esterase
VKGWGTKGIHLGGSTANTYTGTTIVEQYTTIYLEKTPGNALCGAITMTDGFAGYGSHLLWAGNDQIGDDSAVTLVTSGLYLDLAGHSDTIASLALATGTSVKTGTGGVLKVTTLTVNGVNQPKGAYTASSGFVTGTGYIDVDNFGPPQISGVPAIPATPVPASGTITIHPAMLTQLDWGDAQDATSYDVYLWKASDDKPLTALANVDVSEYVLGSSVLSLTDYKWQVVAKNTLGTTDGPEWTFTTIDRRDISNATSPAVPANPTAGVSIDAVIGSGNSGRLVGETKNYAYSSVSVPLNLNGQSLTLDGYAYGLSATGAISGSGTVVLKGWGKPTANAQPVRIGGSTGNTYTGTTTVDIYTTVSRAKTSGNALCSTITVTDGGAGYGSHLLWAGDDQISDDSAVTLVTSGLYLDLAGHSDTIDSLTLPTGTTVETGTAGVLTVTHLTVNGVIMDPGTYTSSNAFVTGTGSVVVPGTPPAIVDVPDAYINANVVADLGAGNAATRFNLLGNATFGSATGTLTGAITLNDPAFTLTLDTGGNTTVLRGVLSGTGALDIVGGGAVTDCSLAGSFSNTLSGMHRLTRGTLALAKPAGTTAIAGNVVVGGGDSQAVLRWDAANQIADTASITLQGLQLAVLNFNGKPETVGTLELLGNAEILLGSGAAVVNFAASDAVSWTEGMGLVIREWDGSPIGGGAERVVFGTSNTGLTSGQLAQVSFLNPTGFNTGTYPGKLLSTGEVVPDGIPLNFVDISNATTPAVPAAPAEGVNIDAVVPSGFSARLVGFTQTYRFSGGFTVDLGLNGNTLNIDSAYNDGGDQAMSVTGAISGSGEVRVQGWGTKGIHLGGSTGNTYSGTTVVQLYSIVSLEKTSGNALCGNITLNSNIALPTALLWAADDQVSDDSNITLSKTAYLNLAGHSDTVGALALTGDASMRLGSGSAVMHFADSSAASWTAGTQFVIHEWDGSPTGGGTEAVFFGTSASGLSADQLAHIGFLNPAGFSEGIYHAAILETGEVVPTGTPVVPIDPPYDLSPEATAARTALYTSTGRADLTAAGTPLTTGTRIVFFGDSITWQNNYINLLNAAIASGAGTQGKTITLINRGINSGTTANIRDGVNGLQASFASLLDSDQADIAVVYIGINDIWWAGTTAAAYEQGLRDMAATAVAKGIPLIFATPAALGESPIGAGVDDAKIDQFSAIVQAVATDTGAAFVNLRSAFVNYWKNNNYEIRINGAYAVLKANGFLTYDGVHPSADGNDIIADQMAAGILSVLQPLEVSPFNQWAEQISNTNQRGPNDDPDGDGANNLTEFAFGGDPNDRTDSGKIYSVTEVAKDGGVERSTAKELILTLAVRKSVAGGVWPSPTQTIDGITYTIQGSNNLGFPNGTVTPVDPYVNAAMDAALTEADKLHYEYQSFVLEGSAGLPSKGFLRAKVEQ